MSERKLCNPASRSFLVATSFAALLVVVALAIAVKSGAVWSNDLSIMLALQYLRPPWLEFLLVGVSYIGFFVPFVPLAVGMAVLAMSLRNRAEGMLLIGGLAASYAVGTVVKIIVRRPRPFGSEIWVYQKLTDFSFPSEHALTYTVVCGILIYLAVFRWQRPAVRWPTIVASALLIILVGPSRVFLGAHWPSDVLAGYLTGYAVLVACICTFERVSLAKLGTRPYSSAPDG